MLATATRFFPTLTMINGAGARISVPFKVGQRLFDAVENTEAADLRGPCGGNSACGGCHVVLPQNVYTEPGEDEKDVLDGVSAVTKTSRLGCCLVLSEAFDGAEIKYGISE